MECWKIRKLKDAGGGKGRRVSRIRTEYPYQGWKKRNADWNARGKGRQDLIWKRGYINGH